MKEVVITELQAHLNAFANKDVYIHLETTNGHMQPTLTNVLNAGALFAMIYPLWFESSSESPHVSV